MKKQKSLSGLLFTAKIIHEALFLTSPYLGHITHKIQPQLQGLERVLDLYWKQKDDGAI